MRRRTDHPPALPADTCDGRGTGGDLLVECWQRRLGPGAAFREIYHLFFRKIYGFFARRGFAAGDCMDLAQETFLRVHASLGSPCYETRFEVWLFKIATDLYRNQLGTQTPLSCAAQRVPADAAAAGELTASLPGQALEA